MSTRLAVGDVCARIRARNSYPGTGTSGTGIGAEDLCGASVTGRRDGWRTTLRRGLFRQPCGSEFDRAPSVGDYSCSCSQSCCDSRLNQGENAIKFTSWQTLEMLSQSAGVVGKSCSAAPDPISGRGNDSADLQMAVALSMNNESTSVISSIRSMNPPRETTPGRRDIVCRFGDIDIRFGMGRDH